MCIPATNNIQGRIEAFSTGSHAQKPPKLKASYAQAPPINTPNPSIPPPSKDQFNVDLIQILSLFVTKFPTAYTKGTAINA